MESSFKIGRIAGIQIGIHYTWLFAFFLVAWSLAQGFFPANYPGWTEATYWIVGAVTALLLFVSVLIHELSHSFVAKARGIGVDSITLFIFGGVSNLKTESEESRDEFLISVVGPLTSFALAGLAWLGDRALAPGNSPLGATLSYLAMINLMLGIFNLIPGFPLDGGRVLRSIIWGVTGSMRRATEVASFVGQGFGFLLILWGVSQIFGGSFLNGLWIAFIGWFLNNAAEATRRSVVARESLRGVRVAALMDPEPPIVDPRLNVQDFVFEYVLRRGQRAALLTEDGRLLGIASISDAKKVPQEEWAATPIGRIMTPAPLRTIAPKTELSQALGLLVDGELNQLPVVQDSRLVGMLSRADVLRFLQLRDELRIRGLPGTGTAPNGHAAEREHTAADSRG
jgi:Zn-dependent protease/predicted transcriptional regulator